MSTTELVREIKKAVEADMQQYFTDCLTPDRGYATPIDNALFDQQAARYEAALKAATDALKFISNEARGPVTMMLRSDEALAEIEKHLLK